MTTTDATAIAVEPTELLSQYRTVRALTETLASPLSPEDQVVQSMPDVSPTKWHRAHVTWFFETFVLVPDIAGYGLFDPSYCYLFNSYYETVGQRQPRPERGMITRPGVAEVARFRRHVDDAMTELLDHGDDELLARVADRVVLGLHHEQQHQELLLMDIKHVLSRNPFDPVYLTAAPPSSNVPTRAQRWTHFDGGLVEIGYAGRGFAFDNECPRHTVVLNPFVLADRLVTAGEWKAFIDDDGYRRPELWLSDGWTTVQAQRWEAPLYWRHDGDDWSVFTLHGRRHLTDAEPVVHVSHYEADAFANWAGARLPTEHEWEHAAASCPVDGHFLPERSLDTGALHPTSAGAEPGLQQLYGDVWEWTRSAYLPYPRFAPAPGAIGEYNGKFMSNQMVLRGGACVTPTGHIRATYRNFFPPAARWMFGGVRLAADA